LAKVAKFSDFAVGGRPDVDITLKAYNKGILGRPVKKIKVVVIDHARGIQDLVGFVGDGPLVVAWWNDLTDFLVVEAEEWAPFLENLLRVEISILMLLKFV